MTRLTLLREAERTGRLDVALRSTVDLLREEDRARFEARGILIYPLYMFFLAMTFVQILTSIMIWIFPQFLKILDDLRSPPSPSFSALADVYRWAYHWGYGIALPAIVILVVLIIRSRGREARSGRWFLVPGLGGLFRLTATRNFCEVMGALAGQGSTLLEALRGAAGAAAYVPFRALALRWADGVERGEAFADLVARERLLPPLVREMLVLGVRAESPATAYRRAATHLGALFAFRQRVLFFVLGATIIIAAGFLVAWLGAAMFTTLTEMQLQLMAPSVR
jgi:type II secretory pathway component PulF